MDNNIEKRVLEVIDFISENNEEKIKEKTNELFLELEKEKDIDKRIKYAEEIKNILNKQTKQTKKDMEEMQMFLTEQKGRMKATKGYEKRNKF